MTHEEFEELAAFDALAVGSELWTDQARDHLRTCIPCRKSHSELQETAAILGLTAGAATPPPEIRERLLEFARTSSENPEALQGAEVETRRRMPIWWLASAASFFLALWIWSELRLDAAREQIAEAETMQRNLSEENRRLASREQISDPTEPLAASQTRIFTLSGLELAPSASARVFLSPSNRRALVFFQGLPATDPGRQYELWVIRADRTAPVGVGTFDVGQSGKAAMTLENLPLDTEIKGLAVTLEPRGGVPAPTGAMYLLSKS